MFLSLSFGEHMYIFLLDTYLGIKSLAQKECIFSVLVGVFFLASGILISAYFVFVSLLPDLTPLTSTQPTTLTLLKIALTMLLVSKHL